MPELIVQHAINSLFSERVGMKPENISLSTVPPRPPGPCVYTDLPYAVALRDICGRYKMRAQQNTKYICSSTREATVTHVLNMLISKLTSADIQSTITPDEGPQRPLAHLQYRGHRQRQADPHRSGRPDGDGGAQKDGPCARWPVSSRSAPVCSWRRSWRSAATSTPFRRASSWTPPNYPERNGDGIARKIEGRRGLRLHLRAR